MEREKKRKIAALMGALLHCDAESRAAASAAAEKVPPPLGPASGQAPTPAPNGPSLWSLAGRRDHMDLRSLWQLRMGRTA